VTNSVVVVKIGGSVFTSDSVYRRVARILRDRVRRKTAERCVVVVSARDGETSRLEQVARAVVPSPLVRTLDLLWSTGELRSVALLTLHLHAQGVQAVGLNVHETGLRLSGLKAMWSETESLCGSLAEFQVVVVPGFLATDECGVITSLGRGGSDLSAVLLACGLSAACCELVKDVPGYFTEDPKRHLGARHLPAISYDQVLGMADDGCELVQRQALEVAAAARLRLVVRSLNPKDPHTVVGCAWAGETQPKESAVRT
jgi:aspartate kinase